MPRIISNVPVSNKNYIINGGLDYWQRNINLTTSSGELSGYNSVDRFLIVSLNTLGTRQSAAQSGSRPNDITRHSGIIQFGATSTSLVQISQKIESLISRDLLNEVCSLGFWYNSDTFSQIRIQVIRPTAENNYTSMVTLYDQTHSVTPDGTWRQFKLQGAITMDNLVSLGCWVLITAQAPVNTTGTRYFRYSQIQLNIGSVLPPFSYFAEDIASELAVCKRYYENSIDNNFIAATRPRADGGTRTTTNVPFSTTKRVIPIMPSRTWNQLVGGYPPATATFGASTVSFSIDFGISGTECFSGFWDAEAEI